MTPHDTLRPPDLPTPSAHVPLVAALKREPVARTPVWLMRQAGRYLPEYQAVRRAAGGFLAMATSPELAAEVTLQPVRRFGVDAAILFSDILLPLSAMGLDLRVEEGVGPRISNPVRSAADIDRLDLIDPAERLPYVGEALRRVRRDLTPDCALLGFAGAPFTLAAYAVEGGHPEASTLLRRLMYTETGLFDQLMGKLCEVVIRHLLYQAAEGADALVLFDTWAGQLARDDYQRFVAPWTRRVIDATRGVGPRVVFVRDGAHLMDAIVESGADAVALDWRVPIGTAFDRFGDRVALQGNLDPAALLAHPDEVYRRAGVLLNEVGGRPGHVLSLGHGVLQQTDPASVAAFVAAARDHGARPLREKDSAA